METTQTTNGKQRKSLADQIDRLDALLDGLADALNESVAAAVKEAVGGAVKEALGAVLTQLLANPAALEERLREAAQEAAAPPAPAPEDDGTRRKGPLGRAWQATIQGVKQAVRSALAVGVLIGGAVAAGFFAARGWVYRAAETAWSWGTGLICRAASALGRLLPVAWCT
jgi:hypothetical protein